MLEQLEIRHSDERGRGLFACAPLPADSLVLRALPAAVVADDAEARRRCCVCLARTDRPPCARCGAAVLQRPPLPRNRSLLDVWLQGWRDAKTGAWIARGVKCRS